MDASKDDIIKEAILIKIDMLKSKGLETGHNEQVLDTDFDHFFNELTKEHPLPIENSNISQQGIALGISLYMIGKRCPRETMKLSQFLLQLAKEESLPTIILATVNTLQSGQLTPNQKLKLGKIYQVLDDFFGFHLGKILLATSSPSQLNELQDQNMPYFNKSDQSVKECIPGVSCKDVFGPIKGTMVLKKILTFCQLFT